MKRPALIALCLALLQADPAFAQSEGQQYPSSSASDQRLRYTPQASPQPAGPPPPPSAGLFEGAAPGIGISRQTYSQQDGSLAVRRGLIGTLPIAGGIRAGVGLFSVTHENQKEPEFRPSWTPRNVGPRNRRVAAVGLNVQF